MGIEIDKKISCIYISWNIPKNIYNDYVIEKDIYSYDIFYKFIWQVQNLMTISLSIILGKL